MASGQFTIADPDGVVPTVNSRFIYLALDFADVPECFSANTPKPAIAGAPLFSAKTPNFDSTGVEFPAANVDSDPTERDIIGVGFGAAAAPAGDFVPASYSQSMVRF